MKNRLLHLFAILLLAIPCWCQSRGGEDTATVWPVVHVLVRGNVSGSLEYWGGCDTIQSPDIPRVTAPTSYSEPPLQVLRQMFARDEKMQVTQESNGTIRMEETGVPRDLLNVKIAHISFDEQNRKSGAMYFPRLVLDLIIAAPEVQAFMKDQSIGQPPMLIRGIAATGPRPISGELNNVTIAEALDYMLKAFPGLWVYENCPSDGKSKRLVVFYFAYLGASGAPQPARPPYENSR